VPRIIVTVVEKQNNEKMLNNLPTLKNVKNLGLNCPLPIQKYPFVTMAHGGGGKLMHELIDVCFRSAFDMIDPQFLHDSAVFSCGKNTRMAMTTDSYVVNPVEFPGGDIGTLAVYGTVNDLSMAGARPMYLSVGFILEEGLPMELLWRIVVSMASACAASGVKIITGDTKVVNKGKGDLIFINTTGIGFLEHGLNIGPYGVQPGDQILVNGDIGRHGIAIMAKREGLEFESIIKSDLAPLHRCVENLIDAGIQVHCLRDLTRGGMASALNEIASAGKFTIHVEEALIPVREDVKGACELLGFDPLYVACEGRFIAFVPPKDAQEALEIFMAHFKNDHPAIIGDVRSQPQCLVVMKSVIGTERIVDLLTGQQLPRIC